MRNTVKTLLSAVCLVPVIAFASTTIKDWGFEPNGDVRLEVGNDVVYVSPEQEVEYFDALMAARLQWPVDVKDEQLVIDVNAVPKEQQTLLAHRCGEKLTCSFAEVTQPVYACMLPKLESMILDQGGTIMGTWPSPDDVTGTVNFLVPSYSSTPFKLTFVHQSNTLDATILTAPKPYTLLWTSVELVLTSCK